MNVEWSGSGLFADAVPMFSRKDWGEPRYASGYTPGMRIRYLQNTTSERYRCMCLCRLENVVR